MAREPTTPVRLDQVPPRKRTQRACDQCRRRRTKCDGQSRCKTCTMIGLDCSYGVVVKQTRGPTYIAYLENKVKELEDEVGTLQTAMDKTLSSSEGNAARAIATSTVSSPAGTGIGNSFTNVQEPRRADLNSSPNLDPRRMFVAPFEFAGFPAWDKSWSSQEPLAYPDEFEGFNGYQQSVPFQYSFPIETDFSPKPSLFQHTYGTRRGRPFDDDFINRSLINS